MLTGRCKKDFEKWYFGKSAKQFTVAYLELAEYGLNRLGVFYCSPESMQYGVYVDFFDNVGIDITIKLCGYLKYDYSIKDKGSHSLLFTEYDWSQTRSEARAKAMQKANEIYNSKL